MKRRRLELSVSHNSFAFPFSSQLRGGASTPSFYLQSELEVPSGASGMAS